MTPYEDVKLKGRVKATFVRGQQVRDGCPTNTSPSLCLVGQMLTLLRSC
jgi:hypothetical protein